MPPRGKQLERNSTVNFSRKSAKLEWNHSRKFVLIIHTVIYDTEFVTEVTAGCDRDFGSFPSLTNLNHESWLLFKSGLFD